MKEKVILRNINDMNRTISSKIKQLKMKSFGIKQNMKRIQSKYQMEYNKLQSIDAQIEGYKKLRIE